jgi:hypothetical protein
MENHAQRTLLLLDMADAFQRRAAAEDAAARQALRPVFAELRKRCEVLQGDTRLRETLRFASSNAPRSLNLNIFCEGALMRH